VDLIIGMLNSLGAITELTAGYLFTYGTLTITATASMVVLALLGIGYLCRRKVLTLEPDWYHDITSLCQDTKQALLYVHLQSAINADQMYDAIVMFGNET